MNVKAPNTNKLPLTLTWEKFYYLPKELMCDLGGADELISGPLKLSASISWFCEKQKGPVTVILSGLPQIQRLGATSPGDGWCNVCVQFVQEGSVRSGNFTQL